MVLFFYILCYAFNCSGTGSGKETRLTEDGKGCRGQEEKASEEGEMTAEEILSSADFQRCVDFHGHICPGLAVGYRAARAGLDWLKERRAADEELVALVETDACGADAVQVLTGCTFGKGNFFFKDYGKQTFILATRKSNRGVRIALKPGALEIPERHRILMDKLRKDGASEEERKEFHELHLQRSREILEKPEEDLFTVKPVNLSLPPKARIEPSKPCARCGESTMASKLSKVEDLEICRECLGELGK
jgi:formylmethanofuran dehydrogenase subunit E